MYDETERAPAGTQAHSLEKEDGREKVKDQKRLVGIEPSIWSIFELEDGTGEQEDLLYHMY